MNDLYFVIDVFFTNEKHSMFKLLEFDDLHETDRKLKQIKIDL